MRSSVPCAAPVPPTTAAPAGAGPPSRKPGVSGPPRPPRPPQPPRPPRPPQRVKRRLWRPGAAAGNAGPKPGQCTDGAGRSGDASSHRAGSASPGAHRRHPDHAGNGGAPRLTAPERLQAPAFRAGVKHIPQRSGHRPGQREADSLSAPDGAIARAGQQRTREQRRGIRQPDQCHCPTPQRPAPPGTVVSQVRCLRVPVTTSLFPRH